MLRDKQLNDSIAQLAVHSPELAQAMREKFNRVIPVHLSYGDWAVVIGTLKRSIDEYTSGDMRNCIEEIARDACGQVGQDFDEV